MSSVSTATTSGNGRTPSDEHPALKRLLTALEDHGCRVLPNERSATCPAHDDDTPSLSIDPEPKDFDGVLLHCHAGCATDDILDALGLTPADLFDARGSAGAATCIVKYRYVDEDGRLLFIKERRPDKKFVQYQVRPDNTKVYDLDGVRRVLYQLPKVLAAIRDGSSVFLCEGEKDADALTRVGVAATTWTEGAWTAGSRDKWRSEYTKTLQGADVRIVADRDDAGRHTARCIAHHLDGVASSVQILEAVEGKDAFDHLAAGHKVDEFVVVSEQPPEGLKAGFLHIPPNNGGSHRTNVERYFDRSDGLNVATLAADVAETAGPFGLGPGDSLWVYRDGVYVPDGSETVRRVVVQLTGERHRASYLTNVEQVLKAAHMLCRLPFGTELPDSRYLNLENGLLDWRTSTLLAHSPKIPSIHRLPLHWNADARCPATDEFLRSLVGDDPDILSFVEEIVGAVLYPGHPFHQRAVMLLGTGSNGKGVFLAWLRSLIGDMNVSAVKPQALDHNRFAAAQLYGKLANLAGDVAPTAFVTAERFKEVTAGDVIQAEHKYGQPFSFHPVATIVASFNGMPTTADRSDGFFRRWLVLNFPYRFVDPQERSLAEGERPRRVDVLADVGTPEERSGFLVRAVDGLRRLEARGDFAIPEAVSAATERFREHADPLVAFVQENYVALRDSFVTRSGLVSAYKRYCDDNGHKPFAAARLYEHMPSAVKAALGTTVREGKRHGGVRGFVGIAET